MDFSKKTSSNNQVMKADNRILVRNLIKDKGPISRLIISQITGLSPSTVTAIIKELIDEMIVHEVGSEESTGGRKPVNLEIKAESAGVLAIRLQKGYVILGIMDLLNQVIIEKRFMADTSNPESLVKSIASYLKQLSDEIGYNLKKILRVGLASPGLINVEQGLIERSVNLGWKNVPIKQLLQNELNLEIDLENVSNAAVLAHQYYDEGKGYRNLAYLTLSVGISAGVVSNGAIFGGKGGYACEIGHMAMDVTNGPLCNCGNKGCLESICGLTAILERVGKTQGKNRIDFEEMIKLVEDGKPSVLKIIDESATMIGIAITNLIHLAHPEIIILGGELTNLGPSFLEKIQNTIEKRALPEFQRSLRIVLSKLQSDPGLKGAAAIALKNLFSGERILGLND